MKRHSTTLIIMEMKSKATTSQPPLGWLLSKSSFASPRRIHKVAQVEQKHQTFCNLPYEELVQLCRPQKLLSQAWRGSSTPCYSTCVRPRRRHHPRRSLRWQRHLQDMPSHLRWAAWWASTRAAPSHSHLHIQVSIGTTPLASSPSSGLPGQKCHRLLY